MKKMKVVFPVLILICAGMVVMTGCPSDPEPPISDFDIVLKGGKYQYLFDTPQIEDGKEYEVIFTIENCDEGFVGSHLGGKICYKMDLNSDDEFILSGWSNSVPDAVSKSVKTYTWTFKAGEKNSDSLVPVSPATTPSGGKQYFSLTAQTPSWDNYTSNDNFNIKGGFKVKAVDTITNWVSTGTLVLGNTDDIAGKGELAATEVAKIRAMPANSKITLTVHVTVGGAAAPGYGVAAVGKDWSGGINITVPGDATEGETIDFEVDIKISNLLDIITDSVVINVYNGATITEAELFKPGT